MTEPRRDTFKALLLDTLRGRVLGALVIAALVLGVMAEGLSIYNSYLQIRINKAEVRIREAEAPLAEARSRGSMSDPLPDRKAKLKAMCALPYFKNGKACEGVPQD
jgi:hypothetical protein